MAGAITMKMMSSTKHTSTSGVMLMSGLGCRRLFVLLSCTPIVVLHLVEKLTHRASERGLDRGHAAGEVVEHDDGRDRDHQAERGLHERFGDTRRDRGHAGRARRADALEGRDDA